MLSEHTDTITNVNRPRTTTGHRTDTEILTDFATMLAFKSLLDDIDGTPTADASETTTASGSVARDHAPQGGGHHGAELACVESRLHSVNRLHLSPSAAGHEDL